MVGHDGVNGDVGEVTGPDSRWRPLLFLDVDGVLNTVGSNLVEHEADVFVDGYRCTIPVGTKDRIAKLAATFDMVWLTTWEEKAHRCWHEHIGVAAEPEWPFVRWIVRMNSLFCNKYTSLLEYLEENGWEDRPFVQIDDDAFYHLADRKIPEAGLLLAPNTDIGLADAHVEAALAHAEKFAE